MPTVTITSPTSGGSVGPGSFEVTGSIIGIIGPIPNPPPISARIKINGQTIHATSVTMNDAGGFIATFPRIPPGTDGAIIVDWTPTGDSGSVDGIVVKRWPGDPSGVGSVGVDAGPACKARTAGDSRSGSATHPGVDYSDTSFRKDSQAVVPSFHFTTAAETSATDFSTSGNGRSLSPSRERPARKS